MAIITYNLCQHTILIHFQACYEDGLNVCLRSGEVKPKFDRFLVKKGGGKEKILSEHKNWVRAKNPNGVDIALKYRMTITCDGGDVVVYKSRPKEGENKLPGIFYANTSQEQGAKTKYGVFFNNGLTVKILCFDEELVKFIDENIAEFFAVTNFGTMQNKGFGSFTISDKKIKYSDVLKSNYNANKCLWIKVNCQGCTNEAQNEIFDTVKQVYSVMKSGQNIVGKGGKTRPDKYIRSFIYVYMKDKHIGNEKAFVKQEGVAPIRTTTSTKNHEHIKQKDLQKFRYVRALLGVGEQTTWLEQEDEQNQRSPRREMIKIVDETYTDKDCENKNIERFASPIFFKIINNDIYITASQPDHIIYGRKFKFTNEGYIKSSRSSVRDSSSRMRTNESESLRIGNSIEIQTLTQDEGFEFDISDFLSRFMDYYNKNIGKMRKSYMITEV